MVGPYTHTHTTCTCDMSCDVSCDLCHYVGSASDGLEEGEVLSDADLDQTLCAPGQEESGQLLESVPNKPHKKLRLRSIAQVGSLFRNTHTHSHTHTVPPTGCYQF